MVRKDIIKNKIEKLLSKEYYCTPVVLNEKGNIYSINIDAEKPYIKIMAYQNCIVVCTSKELYPGIKELLRKKSRDEIFEVPFVYGQTIHYVPDNCYEENMSVVSGFLEYTCEDFFGEDISLLKGLSGFENSLAFDEAGVTSTKGVCLAKHSGRIVGIAGAAKSSVEGVWEVGIDVLEGYRNSGLGTFLVTKLTKELLKRDIVPFYSASVTNIGSQMVAHRCGYVPFWVDTFGTVLDGSSVYRDIVDKMLFDI